MEKIRILLVCMLIELLQTTAFSQFHAVAQSTTGAYSVTVNTPGTFGQIILQTVDNWSDVVDLTISGHLNAADMAYFQRMQNLKKLDVSNTDITSIGGCSDLSQLESIVLPADVTTIEDNAFSGCSSLSSFALNNIESIGASAFNGCNSLSGTIHGPKVKTIGSHAFYRCLNIESISFPVIEEIGNSAFDAGYDGSKLSSAEIANVKYIGERAFQYCSSLKSINLPNCIKFGANGHSSYGCFQDCRNLTNVVLSDRLTEITSGCFRNTGIQQIDLPANLTTIGESAFEGAKLSSISIPEGVKDIENNAFSNCPLENITLPSTLESIEYNSFFYRIEDYNPSTGEYTYSYVLKDVYCKSIVPIVTSVFNNDMAKSATLHVPVLSVSAYKLDENWYKFNKIVALEGNLSDLTINNTFTLIDYTGLSDNVNLTLKSSDKQNTAGHLTIGGRTALSLNNYIQRQNFKYVREEYRDENDNYVSKYTYPYCTTLITDNEVRANNVTTKIQLPTNRWSFISFPYDVNVSSIVVPEGTMWVVRKYNGANRAAMSGETWENVTSGQVLNAGEGYIFHCINENGDSWNTDYVEFEFPAVNNSNKNNIFSYEDVVKTIKEYPSELSHNRGWNLIGNPYPAYLSSQYIDFPAPITVWDDESYIAYSLADDEYVLRPNEAFFVQCPVDTKQIKFLKDGRTHSFSSASEPYRSRAMTQTSDHRSIFNFIISDENYSDRTRLVLNETASCDYEIERDASKFMSSNETVPQIYLIDNGVKYAIDERPLGTGEYTLGIHIGREGNYKISLNSKNSEYEVLLIDKRTNEITNLNDGSYSFDSESQTMNNRFNIKIRAKGDQSSIEDIETDTVGFHVNGNRLYIAQEANINLYSVDGKLVYSGIVDGSVELFSGIYILSINGNTHKIAIK